METCSILIIDDDRSGRVLLGSLLAREPYRLEYAEDGPAGLEKARQLEPDLILLDVVMPGMDGFEVCREIRKDARLAEVPVLMLTALEDQESRLLGIEAGADDFITKPYRAPELRARVQTVVRLNRYRRLRVERARLGWVLEQAEEAYLLLDHQGQLLDCNSKASALLGLKPGSDVLPSLKAQFNLVPADSWEGWPALPSDQELFLVRAESEGAPAVWLSVRVLRQSLGEHPEVLLQFRDVSAERSSQRSIWSFESLIGHKLRTPMTQISLGLGLLQKKAERMKVEQIQEVAQSAQMGLTRLKSELEAILAYINAPSAVPRGGGVSLGLIRSWLEEAQLRLEIESLEVVSTPEAEAIRVGLAPQAFELILLELLQNARKFHPAHQPSVRVEVSFSQGCHRIEVRDNGRRLTPEQLRRAFSPYYQGEKGYSGQVPGMGLGLSMVRSLLWEVGGQCALFNRQDQEGLVVQLRIPVGS